MVYPQYPQEYEQYREPPKSPTEVIIGNIIKGVIGIFLIVIFFFVMVLLVSTLNNQTGVDYTTYTDNFPITNPTLGATIYTSNPHLGSIVVTKYNATNASWGGVPSTDYSFDADTTALVVTAGLEHTITTLRVNASTTYAEPPTLSFFSAIAIAMIILAIAGIFGIVGWKHYDN